MPETRSVLLYLKDILDAIEGIKRYIGKMDFEKFQDDEKTKDAVIRKLEIIGEATKRLPETIRKANPETSWKSAMGLRDRLAHGYFEVADVILWETIVHDLPPFEKVIRKISDELHNGPKKNNNKKR
jgi:uncharacterized protein with HEPN domain